MTGDQRNRRNRIVHRLVQIAMGPAVLLLALLTPVSELARLALCATARRARHTLLGRGGALADGRDRVFAAVIGIACDITYGLSFLGALVYWAISKPSIIRFGKPLPDTASRT